MNLKRVWIKWVVVALAAALLVFVLARPRPVEVDVAVVARDTLRVTVETDGRTQVRDRFTVTAPVTGRVQRITLLPGDSIRMGTTVTRMQPLALDPRTRMQAEANVAASEAMLAEARTFLATATSAAQQAQRTAERFRAVDSAGGISAAQLEQVLLELRLRRDEQAAAESRVQAAMAQLKSAQAALVELSSGNMEPNALLPVIAPASGVVLRVPDASAREVQAGSPLLEIGDPRRLEVVVDVLSSDAVRIQPGQMAWLEDWGGAERVAAVVRRVEPSARTHLSALGVEEQRVDVLLDIPDAPPAIGDGYRVEAHILVSQGDDVVVLPSSSLFNDASGWSVFLSQAGRAVLRRVDIGRRSASQVEVVSGVAPGDTVVVFPPDVMENGTRIRARR